MNRISSNLLYILLIFSNIVYASPFFDDYENENTLKKYSQFHCYKHKICTPGPPQVCGYDMKTRELAVFEDKCTFHRINCKGGFFKIVDMLACDSKKAFMAMQNMSFEWQHIKQTVSPQINDLLKAEVYTEPTQRLQEEPAAERTSVWGKVVPFVRMVMNKLG